MENYIYAIGLTGQVFFTGRVFVQWIASERAGQSLVPPSFWLFSIIGSLLLLTYAILRRDPVFTIGQAFGLFVYVRNLQLLKKTIRA